MYKIKLSRGLESIVSPEDFDRVSKYKWCASNLRGYTHYAMLFKNGATQLMHRFILGLIDENDWSKTASYHVDHVNGNGLDNRRENLRLTTCSTNSMNRHSKRKSSSKYKGVTYVKDRNKWFAQIKKHGKRMYLGQYDTEEMAAKTYDKVAIKMFGEHACLNFKGELNGKVY